MIGQEMMSKLAALICGYSGESTHRRRAAAIGLGFLIRGLLVFSEDDGEAAFTSALSHLTAYIRRIYQPQK